MPFIRATLRAVATAAGLLVTLVAAAPAAAQANPYTLDGLVTLVRGGVAPGRLAELADRSCLGFSMDREAERQLRGAGAGDDLLSRLSRTCVVVPGPRISLGSTDLAYDPAALRQMRLAYAIRVMLIKNYDGIVDVRTGTGEGRRTVTLSLSMTGSDAEERSETVLDAQTLASISYRLNRTRQEGVGLEMELRREGDRIVGWARATDGGRRTIDEPVFQNSILPGAEEMILQTADLAVGQAFTFNSFNLTTARACTYTMTVERERSIRVPAGTFDTYQIRVSGCDYDQRLYVRKEAPHVTIKQDFTTTKVDLRSLSQ